MEPLITIITPAYNHGEFIQKCIESALSQTYTNWEQIIVDDASTDNTYKIASTFALKDKRIKIIRHKKNWGIKRLADNYNQALKFAHGEYIAILESDDFWPKNKLEKQIKSFNDKEVVFSYGNCILTNKSGFPIKLFTYRDNNKLLNNQPTGSILHLFYNLNFAIIPVTAIIKKSILSRLGGFKKDKNYPFTDIPTFLRIAIEGKFSYVDEILGYYRKQQDSYWFDFASKTSAMGRDEILKCIVTFLEANKGNRNMKNFHQNNKNLIKYQRKYLKTKKLIKPFSLLLNRSAFEGKINPVTIIFIYQYLCYKIRNFLK
jgi:glycosyltransferase involved in cell wall biosynthesis